MFISCHGFSFAGRNGFAMNLPAGESGVVENSQASIPSVKTSTAIGTHAVPQFNVREYVVKGKLQVITNSMSSIFDKYTGTNVGVEELVKAASDLHMEYVRLGYPMMSVAIPLEKITNGVVTLNVFPTAVPQVVVSGQSYLKFTNAPEIIIPEMAASPAEEVAAPQPKPPQEQRVINTVPSVPPPPAKPASSEQIAQARAALLQNMAEAAAREKDTRIHVVSTNAGPRFEVEKYLVLGNSVLPPLDLAMTLTNIDGAYGTNVSFDGIRTVLAELQGAYREHGYVTVAVGLPQQKLTNQTVKVQVTEGRLAVINVKGNHYFSSNNVMRALPSLHTDMVLNGPIFQAELNRANASRDRQIYPVIGPGPDPGTSALTLGVKDQLPIHGKVDFNNQSSPGTPDLRVNTSVEADNLWQLDHSLGVQYGFSPAAIQNREPVALL